jgi:hypothetical protein
MLFSSAFFGESRASTLCGASDSVALVVIAVVMYETGCTRLATFKQKNSILSLLEFLGSITMRWKPLIGQANHSDPAGRCDRHGALLTCSKSS